MDVQSPPPLTIERLQLGPMANFIYLLVPRQRGRLAVVDPAWDAAAVMARAEALGRPLTDIILTHHHADHCNAVEALLARYAARVHVHKAERPWLKDHGWLSECVLHEGGDVVDLGGGVQVTCIHTPGHTPGSQCLLCGDGADARLLTGDTLFVDGCGRCDLPGGDPRVMYDSLDRVLGQLDGQTRILPGHDYAPQPDATLAEQRSSNPYLQCTDVDAFVAWRMRPRR
jgi:hydroxyacylglutathione hydrolase